ncbi:MAG: LamG domain-containing protein [Saprospiraceae bacterium]|nr:LamG domain-containing protein [Saprospiraceae bacterium]
MSLTSVGIAQNNYSLDFSQSNNDYVVFPSSLGFNNLDGMTISMWVKIPSICGSPACNAILDMADDEGHRYSFGQDVSSFGFRAEGNAGLDWIVYADATPYENQWVNITAVADHNVDSAKICINGIFKEDAAFISGSSLISLGTGLENGKVLGTRNSALNAPFTGWVDNLSIWSYAMTAAQVQNLYESCIDGSEIGLIAFYDFEDGLGTVLTDRSGNNFNGTLVNSPQWSQDVSTPECLPQVDTLNSISTQIDSLNLYLSSPAINGIIMHDQNGFCWKITVSTSGTISTRKVQCPD